MKSGAWLIVFVVVSLLLIFLVFELNIFRVSLQPVSIARVLPAPNCITPPAYPQLIMQSGNICSGTYNYGIGIGANNIKVTCRPTSTAPILFRGNLWNGKNGLTISGKRNITVQGCNFANFKGNGVFVGNATNYTSEINLLAVNSSFNNESGIFVGHNVVNIYVNDSEIASNNFDGFTFRASYLGFYNNSNATLFSRGIYVSNNKIVENHQNGIYFDAFDYWAYNLIPYYDFLNNSVSINQNNISFNGENGIKNKGFGLHEDYSGSFRVLANLINFNGRLFNGSGISLIANKSQRVLNVNNQKAYTAIAYVFSNDLMSNFVDGITAYAEEDISVTPSIYLDSGYSSQAYFVMANYIRDNARYGISMLSETQIHRIGTGINAYQNYIGRNGKDGVYLLGKSTMSTGRVFADLECNDILSNGANTGGNSDGIKIKGNKINFINIDIVDTNIIEQNLAGISVEYNGSSPLASTNIYARDNYIGFNNIGAVFNDTNQTNSNTIATIVYNDFDQNNLQAWDNKINRFQFNWWSDYSPTCVDSNPQDGWCDIPRPIPIANQDIEPKAGAWWGHKNRGYFVMANPGVVPKASCQTITLPPLPIITVPDFGNPAGGSVTPVIIVGGGPGGGSPSGTPGSDGTTGGFVKGGK